MAVGKNWNEARKDRLRSPKPPDVLEPERRAAAVAIAERNSPADARRIMQVLGPVDEDGQPAGWSR